MPPRLLKLYCKKEERGTIQITELLKAESVRGASQNTDIVLNEEGGTVQITELRKAESQRDASEFADIV